MAQLRVGTRSSTLAIAQTRQVTERLEQAGFEVELVPFETKGDQVLDRSLHQVGGKGLFTAELEEALLSDRLDLAVHSLKDLPTELPDGLVVGAYTLPSDPRDVLIAAQAFKDLPAGTALGTSSLRRAAFLRRLRPDLVVSSVRGNLQTRLRKWQEGQVDGLVLAAAGVLRLGWEHLIIEYLDPLTVVPAPGQGVLAVECAAHRTELARVLALLNDERAMRGAMAERAVLAQLGGGCQVPLGAYAEWVEGQIHLVAQVASLDGRTLIRKEITVAPAEAETAGRRLGLELRQEGALALIQTAEGG
jgi:hydroxymethylbilane synthase